MSLWRDLSPTRKRLLAGAAALLALGGGLWALRSVGPEALGGPTRVDVGGGGIARLDTLALERRVVTASVTGRVEENETETDVLLVDGTGAITVRLDEAHGVDAGSVLLIVGRVRDARGWASRGSPTAGRRWLDAEAWSEVVGGAVPSMAGPDSVHLAPDTTRFGNESDRSPERSDRSGTAR